MASSESFGGWTTTFTDPRPCAAIVDRLTSTAPSSDRAVAGRPPSAGVVVLQVWNLPSRESGRR
ncbi:MAG TPA: hypothetical protein VGD53_25410 [Actinoallomurus sp.]